MLLSEILALGSIDCLYVFKTEKLPYVLTIKSKEPKLRIRFIRPRKDFASPKELIELASGNEGDAALLHFMDVQLLPLIVDDEGLPLVVPNLFLAHVAFRSSSATGDTARTYSESLLSWLRFLQGRNTEQHDATEELVTVYRNALVNRSTADGQRLHTPTTVNLRLAVVEGFYKWGQRSGAMRTDLGEYIQKREREGQSNVWRGPGAARRTGDSLRVGVMQRLPRVLNPEEISSLFLITPQPYKLMFRWGVATGMRRFEVCSLRRSTLASVERYVARGQELIPIDIIRKGGKPVTVHAPAALVEETLWYCLMERQKEASAADGDFVFLSMEGRPFARGSISRVFRQCANQIGSDATLHHLRHTFATLVLGILEGLESRSDTVNSIKTVQILLGHANVTTTEVYLRALNVASEDVRKALSFLYGATL